MEMLEMLAVSCMQMMLVRYTVVKPDGWKGLGRIALVLREKAGRGVPITNILDTCTYINTGYMLLLFVVLIQADVELTMFLP